MGTIILKEGFSEVGGMGHGDYGSSANCVTSIKHLQHLDDAVCMDDRLSGLNVSTLHLAGRLCYINKLQSKGLDCRHRYEHK